MSAGFSLKL